MNARCGNDFYDGWDGSTVHFSMDEGAGKWDLVWGGMIGFWHSAAG